MKPGMPNAIVPDDLQQPDGAVRVMLRPFGTPLPLALAALAVSSTCVSSVELHWIPLSQARFVALALVAMVAPVQLVASVFGFMARDPAAGTGMAILSGTWATLGLTWHFEGATRPEAALGVFLVTAGAVLSVPAVATSPTKPLVAMVLFVTASRLVLSGVSDLAPAGSLKEAAGILGVVLAGLAWYAALALELEGARHKQVLPTMRIGGGRQAMTGSFSDEVRGATHEPGVRQQL
jgi:hypothetical protein